MSDLTIVEKLKLEKIFEMAEGYVVDFSNATFKDFILDSLGIDVYSEKYNFRHSGSKANRLRALWEIEDNSTVGKLLEDLLEYISARRTLNQQFYNLHEQDLFKECIHISARLKKGISKVQDKTILKKENSFSSLQSELLLEFDKFASSQEHGHQQKRGYQLENLLMRIFSLYEIKTQESFKRNEGGEQIDGAFKFEGWYYLVECKWTKKLTDIRQLDSLSGKINRSGKQTLGLFMSINGWSKNVCPLLKQNYDKSIILMDGYDLRCVLNQHLNLDLKNLLAEKLDHLNIKGEPFYSATQLLDRR